MRDTESCPTFNKISVAFPRSRNTGAFPICSDDRDASMLIHVEMKAWDPDRFTEYMRKSLKHIKNPGERLPGQMSKDLTIALRQAGLTLSTDGSLVFRSGGLERITKRWAFDGRMAEAGKDVDKIVDEFVDILRKDPGLTKGLLRRSGVDTRGLSDVAIDEFFGNGLKDALRTIFVL